MSESQNIGYKMLCESENTEYKEKLTDTLEKEVFSFLNADGGSIFIGVKDNGEVVGVPNIDKLQLQVKDRLLSSIAPSVLSLVSLSPENLGDKTALKITYLLPFSAFWTDTKLKI